LYGIEQLRQLPTELAAQGERLACMRADRTVLDDVRRGLATTRRILEGLMQAGTDEERFVAATAIEALQQTEAALAARTHDAALVSARAEIDNLNMEVFLQYLDAAEVELRIRAVLKAADIEFEATIPHMKRRLDEETSLHVVSAIVKAVGLLGRSDEMAFLGQYLAHEDPRVRANAIEGMARSEAAGRFNLYAAMLGDEHHRVRINAAVALRKEDPTALDDLLEELWDEPSPHAHRGAMWVAGRHTTPARAREQYLRGLASPHPDVALAALQGLGDCDCPVVAERLAVLLAADEGRDEAVRVALRERLFALQASTSDEVRAVVVPAVERLLGGTPVAVADVPDGTSDPAAAGSLPPSQRRLRPPKDDGPREAPKRTMWVRLAGRIVYGVKKDPLPQVTIRLSNTGFQELSDRHGRFCFDRIEANKVHVFVCEKQGWPTTTYRYRASGERDQRILIRMRSRGSDDRGR